MREVEMQRELSSRVGPMPSAAPSEITAATHALRSHIAHALLRTALSSVATLSFGAVCSSARSRRSQRHRPLRNPRPVPPHPPPPPTSSQRTLHKLTAVRRNGANAIVRAAASPLAL